MTGIFRRRADDDCAQDAKAHCDYGGFLTKAATKSSLLRHLRRANPQSAIRNPRFHCPPTRNGSLARMSSDAAPAKIS